jgi:Na+/melibiose symporter-like transporter
MFKLKVDFPSLFFVTLTSLLILASVVVLRFHQSKYLLESVSPGLLTSAFSEEEAQSFQEEAVAETQLAATQARPNKRTLDAVTFGLWFIFGIVAYYLCYGFYAAFIHPIAEDVSEAHYVHAQKQNLLKKRLLWVLAVLFTTLLVFGVVSVYRSIVLVYYTASIYDPSIINWAMLLISVAITSIMISFVRLGTRVVIRAY